MKTTIPALSIAAVLMIASMATLFIDGLKIEMIITVGIISGFLTQTALSRIEKRAEFYQAASIVINGIICTIIDSFIHEEKVLIFSMCTFMTSLPSIIYLSFKKWSKTNEEELGKINEEENQAKRLAEAEAADHIAINDYQITAAKEAAMNKPIFVKEKVKINVPRTAVFAS